MDRDGAADGAGADSDGPRCKSHPLSRGGNFILAVLPCSMSWGPRRLGNERAERVEGRGCFSETLQQQRVMEVLVFEDVSSLSFNVLRNQQVGHWLWDTSDAAGENGLRQTFARGYTQPDLS